MPSLTLGRSNVASAQSMTATIPPGGAVARAEPDVRDAAGVVCQARALALWHRDQADAFESNAGAVFGLARRLYLRALTSFKSMRRIRIAEPAMITTNSGHGTQLSEKSRPAPIIMLPNSPKARHRSSVTLPGSMITIQK